MSKKVTIQGNSIVIGDRLDNGEIVNQWQVYSDEIDTEQKVLARVYHLLAKAWTDKELIVDFISACRTLNENLDIYM